MKKQISNRNNGDHSIDIDQLIESFGQYLHQVRGLTLGTIKDYCKYTKCFLRTQSQRNRIHIQHIHPKNIINFILEDSCNKSASHAQKLTYPLRSFFRFLKQTQQLNVDLASFVPSVANRKKPSYPQVLLPDEIIQLLKSCNRLHPDGIRDYAILMLMINFGLRSIEICNLNLDDIDWNNGELTIRGKGEETRFPIFKELGEALVAYLKKSRPPCECEKFFIQLRLPLKGFTTNCVRTLFHSALKRAGLNPKIKGTHLLRHSFAMQLLEQGATLEEIGVVLRHKDVSTTAIYARANFDKLRTIVLPWPQHAKKEGSHG